MRAHIRDTLIFLVVAMCNQIWTSWFALFSYLGSNAKFQNPSISMSTFFTALVYITTGTIFGNMVVPPLMSRLTMRTLFILAGVGSGTNNILIGYCTSAAPLFFCTFLSGVFYQTFQLGTYAYFKVKYGNTCSRYFGIISCGYPIGTVVLLTFIKWFVNPENRGMDYTGFGEPIFDYSVAKNIVGFMWGFGFAVYLMTIFVVATIDDVEEIRRAAELASAAEKLIPLTNTHYSDFRSRMEPRSVGEPKLIKANLAAKLRLSDDLPAPPPLLDLSGEVVVKHVYVPPPPPEPPAFDEFREIRSFRFWFLFVCNATRLISLEYTLDNYHYMAGFIIKDDALAMNAYIVCALGNMAGRFGSGFIFERLGIELCYLIGSLSSLGVLAVYIGWAVHSRIGFALMITVTRYVYSTSIMWCPMALFSLYEVDQALALTKYYDMYIWSIISAGNLFNRIFARDFNFARVYWAFLVVEVGGLLFYLTQRNKVWGQIETARPSEDKQSKFSIHNSISMRPVVKG